MIKEIEGNIFNSSCTVLVNPVNCIGSMGKGLAKQFKLRYPDYFKDYVNKCTSKLIKIGEVTFYHILDEGKTICSLPTKTHWQYNSQLVYVETGIIALHEKLSDHYEETGEYLSVALPMLGCGEGKLKESDVLSFIYEELISYNGLIEVYTKYVE